MSMIVLSPNSPVLIWVISLLRAASIRLQSEERMSRTRTLNVDTLSDAEVKAWGVAAAKSRGPN